MTENLKCVICKIIILFAIVFAIYFYLRRHLNYWTKKGVVQIEPVLFFGNFNEILIQGKMPATCFRDWYDKFSTLPYVGFYVLHRPFLLIRDPQLIKNILVKDCEYFDDKNLTAQTDDRLGKANLFAVKNPVWKYLRLQLQPVYTPGKLKLMFNLILEICNDLNVFLELQDLEGDGKVLEIKDLAARFTTDVIATTAYGIQANSVNDPNSGFRKSGAKMFIFTLYRAMEGFTIFFAPQLLKFFKANIFPKESEKFLRNTLWDAVKKREQSGIKRPDLIDHLIEIRRNQSEEEKKLFELDGDNLVAQAAIFFVGGFETSSTTISFCLYELALHPNIQDEVRQEIVKARKTTGGAITYELVTSQVPYLDMILSETLRMYPPLPFLDRAASKDYLIPGTSLVIEKGTPILIPMMGLHYDKNYYSDPYSFDPEHFSEENKRSRPNSVYLPFGDGPRMCIELRLGQIITKVGLITILSKYEVSVCDKTLIPMKLDPKSPVTAAYGDGFYDFDEITPPVEEKNLLLFNIGDVLLNPQFVEPTIVHTFFIKIFRTYHTALWSKKDLRSVQNGVAALGL